MPGTVDALSVGSAFGEQARDYVELLGASITVEAPRDRLVNSEARSISPAFLLANVIYAMSGSDDLSRIIHYNSRGTPFSDDGATLPNALGKRLCGLDTIDQFSACRSLLERDPSSRRAVVSLYSPDDAGSPSRDCPCLLHLHFLKRGDTLSCVVGVRSQSAAMLFPYDAFLVSMLQESMAVSLDAELGPLIFHFGSLHYYVDEEALVDLVLSESLPYPACMPPMKQAASDVLTELISAEEAIRTHGTLPAGLALDDYWRVYLKALRAAAQSRDSSLTPVDVEQSCFSYLF